MYVMWACRYLALPLAGQNLPMDTNAALEITGLPCSFALVFFGTLPIFLVPG
jgi:hypothetical protein